MERWGAGQHSMNTGIRATKNRSLFATVSSLFTITDEQAMWRVQASDDAHAFAQLVRRWEGPIQRLCTRMLGDEHRGEDLAQETFARLFAKRKDYQPTGRFSTFLWRMALNLCYDELRRIKRRPELALDEDNLGEAADLAPFTRVEPGADTVLLQREEGEIVRQAVLQLSEAYRSVVVLRHYENLKFREIAEVLSIPEGTVKSRMAEALSQLHRILAHVFEEEKSDVCKPPSRRMEESLVL
jgi:RNA polymerase sigma-70 factor (ECF subfamily)